MLPTEFFRTILRRAAPESINASAPKQPAGHRSGFGSDSVLPYLEEAAPKTAKRQRTSSRGRSQGTARSSR